ncbi:MAG TPA: Dyp-type peroxidase, partial [Terriglobia bacterium]|nr:Dyp-type peroxidase [Terriglobia bacterium]
MLDLSDIQGTIVYPFPHLEYARFAFLRIIRPAEARTWLDRLLSQSIITTAQHHKPPQAVNVAFTYQGLKRLGIGRGAHTFPREFREGMANPARSQQLGDTGQSAPEEWQVGHGPKFHLLLMLYGSTKEQVENLHDTVCQPVLRDVLGKVFVQDSFSPRDMREPFGYRDGISQPAIDGAPKRNIPGQDVLKAGEFLLGHADEYNYVAPVPSVPAYLDSNRLLPFSSDPAMKLLGSNGSYLIWRKLEQNVEAFRKYLNDQAKGTGRDPEWVAAKLMGRWRSGAPLAITPDEDKPELGGNAQQNNSFDYSQDGRGVRCPIASHIRRANPRNMLSKAASATKHLVNRHRIIRRGRRYKTGNEEGLLFMAINADIGRQFEFVQQTWLNNPEFGGLYNDKDPISSNQADDGSMAVPRDHVRLRFEGLSRFVRVRGGGYFFLPGMTALKFLASLRESAVVPARVELVSNDEDAQKSDDEAKLKVILPILEEFMRTKYPPGVRPARRQAHAKTVGLVRAEFHVEQRLPVEARVGIFKKPAAVFQAWIRFSNSSSSVNADTGMDIRGMAIKLPER